MNRRWGRSAWHLSVTSGHRGACETAEGQGLGACPAGEQRGRVIPGECAWNARLPGPRFCLNDLGALGEGLTYMGLNVQTLSKILPGRFDSEILLVSDVPWVNLEI